MMLLKGYNEFAKNINNISTTDSSDLVKKTGDNTKINKTENKIVTNHNHDKNILLLKNLINIKKFYCQIRKRNLASNNDISILVKKDIF